MGQLKDLEISKYKRESKVCMPIEIYHFIFLIVVLFGFVNIKSVNKILKKTLLQMKMYYVREYTPGCRFFKIINSTLTGVYRYLHKRKFFHFGRWN